MEVKIFFERLNEAKANMKKALESRFPIGSFVEGKITYNQRNLTEGIVVGHDPDGYLRIKISRAKVNSRQPCRSIFWKNIFYDEMKSRKGRKGK